MSVARGSEIRREPGRVQGGPQDREREPGQFGQLPAGLQDAKAFARPAEHAECRALGHEQVGNHRNEVEGLGAGQGGVGGDDRLGPLGEQELGAGQLGPERDPGRVIDQVRELVAAGARSDSPAALSLAFTRTRPSSVVARHWPTRSPRAS